MSDGLTTPSEVFRLEIEPALADYAKEPLSDRRAKILASAIDHHVDWSFEYYKRVDSSRLGGAADLKAFRRNLISQCPELQMMNELSDAKHHRFLDRPSDPPRVIKESTAALLVQDGQLHVQQYGTAFEPSARAAANFLSNLLD
jgi:hypothetical protein